MYQDAENSRFGQIFPKIVGNWGVKSFNKVFKDRALELIRGLEYYQIQRIQEIIIDENHFKPSVAKFKEAVSRVRSESRAYKAMETANMTIQCQVCGDLGYLRLRPLPDTQGPKDTCCRCLCDEGQKQTREIPMITQALKESWEITRFPANWFLTKDGESFGDKVQNWNEFIKIQCSYWNKE